MMYQISLFPSALRLMLIAFLICTSIEVNAQSTGNNRSISRLEIRPTAGYAFGFTFGGEPVYALSFNYPTPAGFSVEDAVELYTSDHSWSIDPAPFLGVDVVWNFLVDKSTGGSAGLLLGYTYSRWSQNSVQSYENDFTLAEVYLDRIENRQALRMSILARVQNWGINFGFVYYLSRVEEYNFNLVENANNSGRNVIALSQSNLKDRTRGFTIALGTEYHFLDFAAITLTYEPNYVDIGENFDHLLSGGDVFERYGFWSHNLYLGLKIRLGVID